MKFSNSSLVFGGLAGDSLYASAFCDSTGLCAAAVGNRDAAADEVLRQLARLSGNGKLSLKKIEECAANCEPFLNKIDAQVSLAGSYYDGKNLNFFNIGNARIILFAKGYAVLHSDDHTMAYKTMNDLGKEGTGEYDELRFVPESRVLLRALGKVNDHKLQFYEPYVPQKDDALLICTDSFWRYISVVEMELDYRKSAGPDEWLKVMARRVLMRGGRQLDNENFAAVTAMFE